jgi:hypothetical protein
MLDLLKGVTKDVGNVKVFAHKAREEWKEQINLRSIRNPLTYKK